MTGTSAPSEITEVRISFGYIYAITADGSRTPVGTDRGFGIAGPGSPAAPLRCNCGARYGTPRDFLGHAGAAQCSTFA